VVSAGSYILGAAALAALVLSLAYSALLLRRKLLPSWEGAPARLVEAITAIALLIWLGELLGTFGLLYAWSLIAASILLAAVVARWAFAASPAGDRTRGPSAWPLAITVGVIALVFAHWGITAKDALDRGIFNFDSLWYHMPFAADIAQSHSTTGLHYTDTVFVNWFYPQNSELLHATGILLTHRDTLSLFLNFGWLALAFLAAWCVGRPYGRGPLTVAAAAIVLECHTLVVREPGAAKNDLMAAALVLAAIAILVNARATGGSRPPTSSAVGYPQITGITHSGTLFGAWLPGGWALAAAGLAAGLAAGTRFAVLPMVFALGVAAVFLAPAGRRWAAAAWFAIPALLAGGYWYLRNVIVAGNPLPEITRLGPISLPHPERLQEARPEFSIAHYLTDTGVWRHYFVPGLHDQFGALWPLAIGGAVAGAVFAIARGPDRTVRWMGGVVLFGMVAYVFTPLSAAGADGAPVAFAINVRFLIPALLAGLALLPLALPSRGRRWEWAMLGVLLAILVVTDRADAVARDPNRLFGIGLALLLVLIPTLLVLFRRSLPGDPTAWPLIALGLAILAIGYPVERHYLRDRFGPASEIPGMRLDAAYRWARDKSDARIGLAGTTAGFLQYGFYGTDLSNRVVYLGEKGPRGAFNAIPTCARFRAAVDAADLDYLVTAPFLNFIHPDRPIPSPEPRWLRGTSATPILHSGPVTVWRLHGGLDSAACGPLNAPLRRVPNAPTA
jgi:hypothetical protein